MMPLDKETAAKLALQRGLISPQQAAQMGFGHLAQQASTGQLAPGGAAMRDTSTDQKALEDQRANARQLAETARKAQEFLELNRQQGTGQMWALPGAAHFGGAWNENIGRMNSITNDLAPRQRPPGSGAASDKDMSLFLRSVPNVDYPGPTNTKIVQGIEEQAQRQAQYVQFLEGWLAQNGTLLGAEEAWARRGAQPTQPPARQQSAPQGQQRVRRYNPQTGRLE